jgi:hypothetical protein
MKADKPYIDDLIDSGAPSHKQDVAFVPALTAKAKKEALAA